MMDLEIKDAHNISAPYVPAEWEIECNCGCIFVLDTTGELSEPDRPTLLAYCPAHYRQWRRARFQSAA
jgi:hypothetical protein